MSSNADVPHLASALPKLPHPLNRTNADSILSLHDVIKLYTEDIRLRLKQTPTTTTTTNADDRTQTAPAPRPPSAHTEIQAPGASVTAQCSSCYATSTPLRRKHNGKTVCDICGIYYELYAAHPIPMNIIRKGSQIRSDNVALAPPVSHRLSPAPDTSPTLASRGLTDMNACVLLNPIMQHYGLRSDPLSKSMVHPSMSPQSTKGRMSEDRDTIHRRLPLHTLVTNLEDLGSQPQPDVDNNSLPMPPLHPHPATSHILQPSESLDLGSMSPRSPENIHPQPRSEGPPDNEPRSLDNSQLKEHAGLEVALTAVLATVSFSIVCSEGKEDYPQVCLALGVLRPISLLLHFGAALTTCAISQNGRNGVSSRCLRLFWTVLFGLALTSIIVQVSLYSWTVGNLVTSTITALLGILCSLPGYYLVSLKWYRALQRRRVEG